MARSSEAQSLEFLLGEFNPFLSTALQKKPEGNQTVGSAATWCQQSAEGSQIVGSADIWSQQSAEESQIVGSAATWCPGRALSHSFLCPATSECFPARSLSSLTAVAHLIPERESTPSEHGMVEQCSAGNISLPSTLP